MGSDVAGEPAERSRYDKAARKAERARRARLARLPFLFAYAERGRAQLVLAGVLQVLLVVVVGLGAVKLVTGSWFPPGAALAVLAVSLVTQSASSYVNARAGRA